MTQTLPPTTHPLLFLLLLSSLRPFTYPMVIPRQDTPTTYTLPCLPPTTTSRQADR